MLPGGLMEVYDSTFPPVGPIGFEDVLHFSLGGGFVVFGPTGFFQNPLLPPAGMHFSFPLPPIPQGFSLLVQSLIGTPSADNGFFASTASHRLNF